MALSGNQVTRLWPYGGPGHQYGDFAGKSPAPEPEPEPEVVVADQPSGGWRFFLRYEQELEQRRRKRRELEEREESAQRLADATDREIAQLLRKQEAQDERRAELERLAALVNKHADKAAQDAYGERVAAAMARAIAQGNVSALMALERELERAKEEEDFLMLALLTIEAED